PGQAAIDDAAVTVEGATIVRVEPFGASGRAGGATVADLGEITLCPGLINAHGHLELAHLAGTCPRGAGFAAWVRWLLSQPLVCRDPGPAASALASMAATGSQALADVSTRRQAQVAAACRAASFPALLFNEFFGCWQARPDVLPWPDQAPPPGEIGGQDVPQRTAAAGHALYSTNPEILRLAKAFDNAHGLPFTIHLAEHLGEVELLATGRGEFADLLAQRVLPKDYRAPGLTPVAYAQRLGLLGATTLAVHCVHAGRRDREILTATNTAVCLCPRSNAVIGVGQAPFADYFASSLRLCLGTDSLASNDDLNLWNEARFLREAMPAPPPPGRLLAAMTSTPAQVLGFDRLGALAPGRLARLARVPEDFDG
ncbi:MAG: amidohydrolase family protein, partial [Desulfovibrionaceae bacterium]|nr:amidohydrolase family protein [Desulfovibrionaceae bacterium]